jgi:transcriptional regulator GlxA family with amidase domain
MTDLPPFRLRKIAIVIDHWFGAFEFGIACEVFGIDRSAQGLPSFDFVVCSPDARPVRTRQGFSVLAEHRLDAAADVDLVIVPAVGAPADRCKGVAATDLGPLLREAVSRGARVASLCSGAFTLARAGLLSGRRATTHWFHEAEFRAEFPDVELVPDVLYVEDGPVITSAGSAAAADMCLHLVRRAYGPEAANGIARRMVVPPHRDGGQAQYVTTPMPCRPADSLSPVLDWAIERLDQELTVSRLAGRAAMSERTFARRFRDETGTTPHHWVIAQRVALAERLLETGDYGIEQVAERSGFGSATMLRHHFTRLRGTTPTAYRRSFSRAV